MDTCTFLYCITILGLWVFSMLDSRRPYKYPPGPTWLPVVGNFFYFRTLKEKYKYTFLVLEYLKECYGPLVGLRLGKDRIVIISGKELVRELLTKEDIEGRPDGFLFRLRAFWKKLGVVFTDGAYGLEQRKFFLKYVRDFGRSSMEESISKETIQFISLLKQKSKEGPICIQRIVKVYILNNLWHMMAGKRFSETDIRLNQLLNLIHDAFTLQDMSGGLLNQMPFIRFIAPEKSTYNAAVNIVDGLTKFLRETVDEHKKTFDPKDIRDFIDSFLFQQQNKQSDPDSSFTEEQLLILLMDMFMAGADSTSNAFCFAVIYLINNPHVQELVHEELDTIVGHDRWPSLEDRPNLPYTDAMLMEVLRMCNIGALSVPHRAKRDVFVGDYIIPKMIAKDGRAVVDDKIIRQYRYLIPFTHKDTIVLFNLYSVQMDKKEWGDPETFRPERFLNDRGNVIPNQSLIPFGLGRRRCLGETLARPTLFLFITALLHNFNITNPPQMPFPSKDPIDGAILTAQPFQCVLTPRFN